MTRAWVSLLNAEYVLLDGSMGTELFRRGLGPGQSPEQWNLDEPGRIRQVHRDYVEAGCDLVLTNSFGGTVNRLALHGLDDRVHEVNSTAARLAREVVDAVMSASPERTIVVAGSMGPTGDLLEPLGGMSPEDCARAFADQARGLQDGGADVLWIETMSAIEEVEMAVAGARGVCDLPICATMSFDTVGRTMMGVSGSEAADRLGQLDLAAIGANCGNNLEDSERAVEAIRRQRPDLEVIAKCNAGVPEWKDGRLAYDATPEIMASHAHRVRDLGVRLIGGCCGSTPEHLSFMRKVLDGQLANPDLPPLAGRRDGPVADEQRAPRSPRRRRRDRTTRGR